MSLHQRGPHKKDCQKIALTVKGEQKGRVNFIVNIDTEEKTLTLE